MGPPGAGKGTQARSSPSTSASPRSRPVTSSAPTSPRAPSSARGQAVHGRRRVRPRRGHQPDGAQPHRRARRRARLPARRLPAHAGAGRGARRDDRPRATSSTRSWCSPSTRRSWSSGCCSAPRPRVAPTTPRTSSAAARRSTRADRAAHRRLPRPRPAHRDRRHGRGRRRHRADLRGPRRVDQSYAEAAMGCRTAVSRSSRPSRSRRCGRPGWSSPRPSSCPRRPYAPASRTGELDPVAADLIRSRGATPSFLGYATRPSPPRSARRSTTRSYTGSRATGCSPRATSSPSTAARSSMAGTATPRSPSPSAP